MHPGSECVGGWHPGIGGHRVWGSSQGWVMGGGRRTHPTVGETGLGRAGAGEVTSSVSPGDRDGRGGRGRQAEPLPTRGWSTHNCSRCSSGISPGPGSLHRKPSASAWQQPLADPGSTRSHSQARSHGIPMGRCWCPTGRRSPPCQHH